LPAHRGWRSAPISGTIGTVIRSPRTLLADHDRLHAMLPPDRGAPTSATPGRPGVEPILPHWGSALMAALLQARELEAVADGHWLLRGVSLEVAEGSTVAVIGGAAAGKTVLLDLLLGLRPLRDGTVRLGDRDITAFGTLERQRLGLRCAFQIPPVFAGLTVAEQLALAAPSVRLDSRAFARIAAYLPELEELLGRRMEGLDLPLRRLVDLGRALLGLPRVLLIDNLLPAIGIDRAGELLHGLGRDGYTLLVADRYAEPLLRQADYGYVMAEGRLVASGQPNRLLADDRLLASCAGDPGAYA